MKVVGMDYAQGTTEKQQIPTEQENNLIKKENRTNMKTTEKSVQHKSTSKYTNEYLRGD